MEIPAMTPLSEIPVPRKSAFCTTRATRLRKLIPAPLRTEIAEARASDIKARFSTAIAVLLTISKMLPGADADRTRAVQTNCLGQNVLAGV